MLGAGVVLSAAPVARADGPGYTDQGVNADGYRQISLAAGGSPPPADTANGTYRADVSWTAPDGLRRSYRIIVPAGLPSPAPVVVAMGGLYLSVANTQATQHWEDNSTGQVVVYAQGYGASLNAGACCGYAAAHDVDDVGYLVTTLGHVAAQWPIQRSRTFMTGFSNGAMMAYRFACERSDLVAAIGPVAGTDEASCAPNHGRTTPVAVRHLHGERDTTVPWEGTDNAGFCSCRMVPVPRALAAWERTNKDAAPVAATLLAQVGHRWPRPADGLDATAELLRFFDDHPRSSAAVS